MIYLLILLLACFCVSAQKVDSSNIAIVNCTKPFILFGKKSNRLVLALEKIFVKDEIFWLGFSIRNRSGLSYPVELFRLYIRDKSRAQRSSQQEIELTPLYADSLKIIAAKKTVHFLIALSKFTIPDNKVCLLEMFELNGGRNLDLEISNRQLFLARPIPDTSKIVK